MDLTDTNDESMPTGKLSLEDALLYPVDIGSWQPYNIFTLDEQKTLQKENLCYLDNLLVKEGTLGFIYTKQIDRFNTMLEDNFKQIKITDSITVLEDEIYYTTTLEGARTTRVRTSEIHNGSAINPNNFESEIMVKNAFNATKMLNLYGNRIDKNILFSVWNCMVKDCCHNTEIQGPDNSYRIGEIAVGSHEGVPSSELNTYMDNWISFYNSDILNNKPFIKAAILHYTFENIHPFCDGNGRMGRLLINNYLLSQQIEVCKAVSFSMEIDKTRALYDAAFVNAENMFADCTPFIEYMLQIMTNASLTAIKTQN